MKIQGTARMTTFNSLSLSLFDNLETHIKRAREAPALLPRASGGGELESSLDSAQRLYF